MKLYCYFAVSISAQRSGIPRPGMNGPFRGFQGPMGPPRRYNMGRSLDDLGSTFDAFGRSGPLMDISDSSNDYGDYNDNYDGDFGDLGDYIDPRGLNGRYKPWQELDLDSNGDLFIMLDDNRDMITQIVDYSLAVSGSSVMYDQIMEYGCYCNLLDQKLLQGVGEPVDEIDRACRDWRRCRACTRMDDTDCEPDTVPYKLWYDYKGYSSYCAKNRNGCGKWTCQCDTELAKNLADLADSFNPKYSKAGGFKKSKQCKWPQKDWSPPDECCGRYPLRFPFNTEFGKRECCGSVTFNTELGKCCVKNQLQQCTPGAGYP